MTVQRVTITAADEKYAPPGQEIEISVIGDQVFISVYKGSQDDLKDGRKKEYDVPVLAMKDLLAALNAHADEFQGRFIRYATPSPPA